MKGRTAALACLIAGAVLATPQGQWQQVEWFTYGGDPASSKYSPADQITAQNVQRLQVVYRDVVIVGGAIPDRYQMANEPLASSRVSMGLD